MTSPKARGRWVDRRPDRALGVIGDVNYLDYGGLVVFDDGTGDYVVPDENDEDAPIVVYRINLEQLEDPASEWFGDDLGKLASFTGRPKVEIINELKSANPLARASAYYDLLHYYSAENFDSTPLKISKEEAEHRYAKADKELGEMKSNPLTSTRETAAAERLVRRAAAAKFGRGKARPFYEHGQWFVEVGSRMYAVADYRPGVDGTGLDFEAL